MDGLRTTEMFAVLEAKVLHLERLGEPALKSREIDVLVACSKIVPSALKSQLL